MHDKYEEYSWEKLLRLLRERDRKPRFGLAHADAYLVKKLLNQQVAHTKTKALPAKGEAPTAQEQ